MSAMPTGSSESSTCAPVALSTLRTSACAHTAPNSPVLAPTTAAGLSRRTLSGNGRDAQSSAFLSAPGSEALYSGVAIRSASASEIASRKSWTAAGGFVSRSSSKGGSSRRPSHATRTAPGGSASPAARSSLRLWEPRRRLPEMPRIRIGLGLALDQRDLDGQRDVVGEHVAARRQGHVPVDVPVGAVDDGLEVEVTAGVAEGVGGRRGPRARGLDRGRDALDRQVALDLGGAVLAQVEVGGDERHLGMVGGVEELLAEDVRAELLRRADRDRLDLRRALEAAVGERRADLAQRAAEERNTLVADGEAEARVDGIGGVGAGERSGGRAHDGVYLAVEVSDP